MEPPDESPARVAFSFRPGTFDLGALCPGFSFPVEDGMAQAVRLDRRWDSLLQRAGTLGVMLVSAQSGPLSFSDTWEYPSFARVPGTKELIELDSGTELRTDRLDCALAVIEEVDEQQLASLQFFDKHGDGCFKLILTNWSNLGRFDELVSSHAIPRAFHESTPKERCGSWEPGREPRIKPAAPNPAAARAREFWQGLRECGAGNDFPGLEHVTRREGLQAAGVDLAWQIDPARAEAALDAAASAGEGLRVTVSGAAATLPGNFRPARHARGGCGKTYFSSCSQFSVRRCRGPYEIWAVRLPGDSALMPVRLEYFDAAGNFSGSVELGPDTLVSMADTWESLLGA